MFERVLIQDNAGNLNSASIRWRGKLGNNPSTWLGLEYDNEEKGKHSGVFKGEQKFQTYFSDESGSFMKQEALEKMKTLPRKTILEALREDYPDFFTDGDREFELEKIDMGGRIVESVGIGYRKKKLKVVGLQHKHVTDVDDFVKKAEKWDYDWAESVKEVNLSQNFIRDVKRTVELIKKLFKNVNVLSLDGNPLDFESFRGADMSDFIEIRLNSTGVTLKNLETVLGVCSNLKEIHLEKNLFEDHSWTFSTATNIETVYFSFNECPSIPSWLAIAFPICKELTLNFTGLTDKIFESRFEMPLLDTLSLMYNKLSDVHVFDKLHQLFPRLSHLHVGKNEFTMKKESLRQIAIAKIPTLTNFNRSDNLPRERKESEIDYLRLYFKEYASNPSLHPRYKHLESIHGKLSIEEVDIKQKKSVLLHLVLESSENQIRKQKKIPVTMNIQKLKLLAQKLFKITSDPTLTLLSTRNQNHSLQLTDGEISNYSPDDDDVILVSL